MRPKSEMEIPVYNSGYARGILPTAWQTAIFINYGKTDIRALAEVLGTDEATVAAEARRMGLERITYDENWEKRGYVTIIRDNWHVLSLGQIARLVGVTVEKLEDILRYEDFLLVKLGNGKPATGEVRYSPLTPGQVAATDEVRRLVTREYVAPTARPFDFFSGTSAGEERPSPAPCGERIVYSYCARYGDFLADGDFSAFSDELLSAYASRGITGLWFEGLLSNLAPDWFGGDGLFALRQKNLAALCEKCARYGIKIFLYFNEPRAVKEALLPAEWRGERANGLVAMCLSVPAARERLLSAAEAFFRAVPGLGGIITITKNENFTHCGSRRDVHCPRCSREGSALMLAARVNNIFAEAARRAGGKVRVIANLWGWERANGWSREKQREAVSALDPYVEVMVVSEFDMPIEKGGVPSRIIDYSISNVGPARSAAELLRFAADNGHSTWAKIQVNTSWECSAVPCLPSYELVAKHLARLSALGVTDYMASWTLGGYPSAGLELMSRYYRGGDVDLGGFYRDKFGADCERAREIVSLFTAAFTEFPFSVEVLYYAPHTLGAGELWTVEPGDEKSTMVCFSFDDIESYSYPFGPEVYISQMKKTVDGMRAADKRLCGLSLSSPAARELYLGVKGALLQYEAALNHATFTMMKRAGFPDVRAAIRLADAEADCVRRLYKLVSSDARMGFEATNHYYYNENTLLLKLVNLDRVKAALARRETAVEIDDTRDEERSAAVVAAP